MDYLFNFIIFLDDFYWSYIGWALIIGSGIYLTIISRGFQFRALYNISHNIKDIYKESKDKSNIGVHPFKLYFASVGGMIGLGNIVFISLALTIGGPGSIFWTVIASFCGMLLKYSEIFLGVKYRKKNERNGYNGGPMYFLQAAFKTKYLPYIFCVLLCLYGVEISNFLIIVDRIEHSFEFNRYAIIAVLLVLVIYSSIGGIGRLASICTLIMPVFMVGYVIFSLYIIACNASLLPAFFKTVLTSAFSPQAQIGGFAGSTMIMAAYYGVSKTVYSGDIGIGYDSIVQSESRIIYPKKQATLAIYALLTDTIICLLTNIMLGVTGAWYTLNHLDPSDIAAETFKNYIPYSDIFMTLLLVFAGFTTIIAYLTTGIKCAEFINKQYGKIIYLIYSIFAFIIFCNYDQKNVMHIMGVLSGLLVLINVTGIIKLRNKIEFD